MSSKVKLTDFLSHLAIASEKAACIARHIRSMKSDFDSMVQEKQLDEYHEHLNADYKTLADVIIQEVIKRDLGALYPILAQHIYGEEDGSLKLKSTNEKIFLNVNGTREEVLILFQKLFNDKSSQSIEGLADLVSSSFHLTLPKEDEQSFEQIPSDIHLDLADIGIWIDPIDGTQQYVYGKDGIVDPRTGITLDGLPTAMVLIGCFDLKNGHALIGMINRAFDQKIDQHRWKSAIYWGIALPTVKLNNLREASAERTLVHGTVNANVFAEILPDWNKLEVSACGNKLLAIALKKANVFLLTKAAAFTWDVCAAHAILYSLGGDVLDLHRILHYYRDHGQIPEGDLTPWTVLYNHNLSSDASVSNHACPPFIAFHQRKDLHDLLHSLVSHNIRFE